MRAIIINAKDRTVTETEIDGSLQSLQQTALTAAAA
jgi:hypothetical protein